MIYIKHFFKGFEKVMDWFFDPSEYSGLIVNTTFYLICAIILFIQSNFVLGAGFIFGSFSGIISFLYNTKYTNKLVATLGLLNSIITLGILIVYFIYFL